MDLGCDARRLFGLSCLEVGDRLKRGPAPAAQKTEPAPLTFANSRGATNAAIHAMSSLFETSEKFPETSTGFLSSKEGPAFF
jgi:hypothetical protein